MREETHLVQGMASHGVFGTLIEFVVIPRIERHLKAEHDNVDDSDSDRMHQYQQRALKRRTLSLYKVIALLQLVTVACAGYLERSR